MKPKERILAVDARGSRFGFAFFDDQVRLLDWGVRSFRGGVNATKIPASRKIAALLDELDPRAIILRTPDWHDAAKNPKLRETVLAEAARRGIPLKFLSRRAVKDAFAAANGNKYVIAAAVASRFPEVAPKLPSKHKIWMSEEYSLSVFDSAALGITYFKRFETPLPAHS